MVWLCTMHAHAAIISRCVDLSTEVGIEVVVTRLHSLIRSSLSLRSSTL